MLQAGGPAGPSQPSCLSPLLSPGAGGRCGVCFIGVVPGPLREGTAEEASPPGRRVRWCQELGPSGPGAELGNTGCLGGSLQTLPLLSRTVCPSHPPLQGQAALEPWGLWEEGPGAAGTGSRAGLGSPSCCGAAAAAPLVPVSPLLASSAEAGLQQLQAVGPVCQEGSCAHQPRSLRVVLWAGTEWKAPVRGSGAEFGATTLLTMGRATKTRMGSRKERPP